MRLIDEVPAIVWLLIASVMLVVGLTIGLPSFMTLIKDATAAWAQSEDPGQQVVRAGFANSGRVENAALGQMNESEGNSSLRVSYAISLPHLLQDWLLDQTDLQVDSTASYESPSAHIHIDVDRKGGIVSYRYLFAAATRFNTYQTDVSFAEIRHLWTRNEGDAATDTIFDRVAVLEVSVMHLSHLLGRPGNSVLTVSAVSELLESTKGDVPTLVLVPFEELIPSMAVLAVNNQTPIENRHHFNPQSYPLTIEYFVHRNPRAAISQPAFSTFLENLPRSNRDAARLTVIAMTGVTAMVRVTASQMDRLGYDWPAAVVGAELASADITHISNEVPFVPGCETNISSANLVFCSKPEYMATLEASGVDIVGLTGNHQNDYGLDAALESLKIYAEAELPVYGGGVNAEAAAAPLILEHNGNRIAFIGANSYGPQFAWATETTPGSAYFDLNAMSATIRHLKENGLADVVLAELQYQETYDLTPLIQQRVDFNALSQAGADVVTGVQSHVPQAIEFSDGRLILYGLGNLFFDQMWSHPTREGLIVKHTIYDGRHISTRLLPTIVHDFGQPHWATPIERDYLLGRLYQVSYWE